MSKLPEIATNNHFPVKKKDKHMHTHTHTHTHTHIEKQNFTVKTFKILKFQICVFPKIGVFTPKMDGENHGKPWFGGLPKPWFTVGK